MQTFINDVGGQIALAGYAGKAILREFNNGFIVVLLNDDVRFFGAFKEDFEVAAHTLGSHFLWRALGFGVAQLVTGGRFGLDAQWCARIAVTRCDVEILLGLALEASFGQELQFFGGGFGNSGHVDISV